MPSFSQQKSLDFKDVNLIASPAIVRSRKEIPIEGWRIIIAGMTSLIGPSFIHACSKLPEDMQPTLHIPRDVFSGENLSLLRKLKYPADRIFVGVGLDTPDIELMAADCGFKNVLLDVANGYLPQVMEKVDVLKKKGFYVVAGSIHTGQGLAALAEAGCDVIRDGIAPGSVCITEDSTGFTRGKITEISTLYQKKIGYNKMQAEGASDHRIKTLSDGGITCPADIVKAFGGGADYIMTGRLFVHSSDARMHNMSELKFTSEDDTFGFHLPYHTYFGQASYWGKKAMNKINEDIEGKDEIIDIPFVELKDIFNTIWDGIRSGISYSGYASVDEFIGNGVFEVKA